MRSLCAAICIAVLPALAGAQKPAPGRHRAVVDMGSGALKLLITDPAGRVVVDEKMGAGLGRGIGPDGLLPRANRERATERLRALLARAAEYGIRPDEVIVFATAAVRNARGRLKAADRREGKATGRMFVKELERDLGVKVQILSHSREALANHAGALAGFAGGGGRRERFVVIDAGASSSQDVFGTRKTILAKDLTRLGSNQISEYVTDVQGEQELAGADVRLAAELPALPKIGARGRGATPVLIGGIARFLAHRFRGASVSRADLEALRLRVASLEPAARRPFLIRDAAGALFSGAEQETLGFHADGAPGEDYGSILPAKLSLVLRHMSLLEADRLYLSQTDARYASDALVPKKAAER